MLAVVKQTVLNSSAEQPLCFHSLHNVDPVAMLTPVILLTMLDPWLCFLAGFTTFQPDKSAATGRTWDFHRKCTLEPADPSHIRIHERHLRKAGPLRAVAAYARDKNVLKLVGQLHC